MEDPLMKQVAKKACNETVSNFIFMIKLTGQSSLSIFNHNPLTCVKTRGKDLSGLLIR